MRKRMGMKKIYSVLLMMLILLNFNYTSLVYAKTTDLSTDKKITDYIDGKVNELIKDKKSKGAIVSVVKDNNVLLSKGYGYADEKNNIKADGENTAFRIGSVSKTFVAFAAMQMVEQGKLDMNAPISKYLGEDSPKLKYPVTMHDLLTHTAGFEEKSSGLAICQNAKEETLGSVLKKYLPAQVFKPGEVEAYSNYGGALAGYVIEKICGKPFSKYAEENILKPLKMDSSTFDLHKSSASLVSKGYKLDGREGIESLINIYPAGSMTSTASDMAKYMNFLMMDEDSSVLGNKAKEIMFSQQFKMDKKFSSSIGYAWGRNERNGHFIYLHEGGTDNFSTIVFIIPDQKLGVFISANTQCGEFSEIINTVLNNRCGAEQKKEPYSGKNQIDISGNYISVRSSFKSDEKFYNLLNTESGLLHISGNVNKGFILNGKKFTSIGRDMYCHPDLGNIKQIEKNGRIYITNDDGQSFIRVPWYEGFTWQISVLGCFVILTIVVSFISAVSLIRGIVKGKKSVKYSLLAEIPALFVFAAAAYTFIHLSLFFDNVVYSMAEEIFAFTRKASELISILGFLGVLSTIHFWLRKRNVFIRLFYAAWSISYILFLVWLIQSNLLF
ncbi:serine hydrolase domain-containing protein [Clostridium carboxidivorans]|nr:serine hydrolase domain-containing protein [Clostridium carboxidivorans]